MARREGGEGRPTKIQAEKAQTMSQPLTKTKQIVVFATFMALLILVMVAMAKNKRNASEEPDEMVIKVRIER